MGHKLLPAQQLWLADSASCQACRRISGCIPDGRWPGPLL